MGMFDPRTLGELLISLIPDGHVAYWVNSDGDIVVVIREKTLAQDMLKQINYMRMVLDEEEGQADG